MESCGGGDSHCFCLLGDICMYFVVRFFQLGMIVVKLMESDDALGYLRDMPLTPSNWTAVWDSDVKGIFSVPPLSPLSPLLMVV